MDTCCSSQFPTPILSTMRISIYVPSFAGLVTGLIISPITLRHPPSTTIKPPPRITERAILEKRDYISVCPTPGNPSGCQLIGVDEVLTEPSGGKYVPECNEHGDCHYIGYEDPVSPITGDSTYIITSASSEVYIFPVPIPLPPNEPAPPPPVEPELNSEFTCKTTSWTTSTETTTYSAVFNDDWLANGISTQGSSTFLQPFGSLATTTAADLSCMVDGAPWYSPTRWALWCVWSECSFIDSFLSWCDCGLKTFPTLSPNPSSTGVNCDYTSLPASQLSPKQTSSAPTNKPGVGGKPACQYMLNGDGGLCSYANCKLISPMFQHFIKTSRLLLRRNCSTTLDNNCRWENVKELRLQHPAVIWKMSHTNNNTRSNWHRFLR